jgi:cytochrome P450
MPTLLIADPEMTQDLFNKKNSIVDKTGKHQFMFEDLLGKSFVFSKGDKTWQSIRKACAHAFYKERLSKMMLVVKEKVELWVEKRHKEIQDSKENVALVDISKSFERLFCKNIVHICFGEDISETLIEIDVLIDPSGSKYER